MTAAIGELCAGYGGLGMGVNRVFDSEVVWYSDIDKGALKVLGHRFPWAPNIGDMTTVNWADVPPVDILCAGYPCQPFSHAGKRKGTDDSRHLWPHVREAIRHLRPTLTLLENVSGHRSLGFDRVLGDLAEDGMHVVWTSVRASDVGAPHRRERLFILVAAADDDLEGLSGLGWLFGQRRDTDGRGSENGLRTEAEPPSLLPTPVADHSRGLPSPSTDYQSLPNAVCALFPTPRAREMEESPESFLDRQQRMAGAGRTKGDSGMPLNVAVSLLPTPAVNDMGAAYTPDEWDAWTDRMKAEHGNGNGHGKSLNIEVQKAPTSWGIYRDAILRWESMTGRHAPRPVEPAPKGGMRLAPSFSEWMMGLPQGWVVDAPGVTRAEALRAIGNGVVPDQAALALRSMLRMLERVA